MVSVRDGARWQGQGTWQMQSLDTGGQEPWGLGWDPS